MFRLAIGTRFTLASVDGALRLRLNAPYLLLAACFATAAAIHKNKS